MRLLILSDLHLEFAPILSMRVSCDVVILAGDTNLRLTGVRWAMDTFPDIPVLYVFGNHEFYGEKWPRLIEKGRALAAGSNVHILENDTVEIGGWRFFGATLWSDFQAIGDLLRSTAEAAQSMTDFKRIRQWPTLKRFSPTHARQAHAQSVAHLENFLKAGERSRSVVITHHAPSLRSLPTKLLTDPVSGAYASDLEPLINECGPALWLHGHIHSRQDYRLSQTRILANPRGYPGEDAGFRDELVLELNTNA